MKFLNSEHANKVIVFCFAAVVIAYARFHRAETGDKPAEVRANTPSPDTFIPAGHVLVPIQIENAESVTGLIENFGVVDLYVNKSEGGGYERVAEKIKLIRAPANPGQFAVLVRAEDSKRLMQIRTSFWVVLQNRQTLSAKVEDFPTAKSAETRAQARSEAKRQKITVEYYREKNL